MKPTNTSILNNIIEEYTKSPLTVIELSKKYKISKYIIYHKIEHNKIKKEWKKFDVNILNSAIEEYIRTSLTISEISKKYQLSESILWDKLKKDRIKKVWVRYDENILNQAIGEYIETHKSVLQISKKYKISEHVLYYKIEKNNINKKYKTVGCKHDIDIVLEAIEEYISTDKSYKQISEKYKISVTTLRTWMIKLNKIKEFKTVRIYKHTGNENIINLAVNDYISSNKTMNEISKKYNLKNGSLRHWIVKAGFKPRKRSSKFSDIIEKAIHEYFNNKKSLKQVANQYNISAGNLRSLIRKAGLKLRTPNQHRVSKFAGIMEKATNEYFNSKKSLDKIASKYNMTGGNLAKWIKKSGLKAKSKGDHKRDYEKIKECCKLYLNGVSNKELAIKYNVSNRTILEWIKMNGIRPKRFNEVCGITDELKKNAIHLYVNKKLNCCEISKILKCSNRSVLEWVKDIKRSHSEIMSKVVLENGSINTRSKKGKITTRFGELYYNSSYEEDRIKQIVSDNNVKEFKRCKDLIPYFNDKTGKTHRYNPDFYIEYYNGNKVVEEIKPFSMISQLNNLIKFKAAKFFYSGNNIIFKVITEQIIYGKDISKIAIRDKKRITLMRHAV